MTDQKIKKRLTPYNAPDGVVGRPLEIEYRLNEAFKILFRDELGQMVIDYLTSITINYVSGPEITDQQLRHLEGQRYLVSIMKQRMQHGKEKLPKLPINEAK